MSGVDRVNNNSVGSNQVEQYSTISIGCLNGRDSVVLSSPLESTTRKTAEAGNFIVRRPVLGRNSETEIPYDNHHIGNTDVGGSLELICDVAEKALLIEGRPARPSSAKTIASSRDSLGSLEDNSTKSFNLSNVKSLQDIQNFSSAGNNLKDLKFTDKEIADAMKFDTEYVKYPHKSPLSSDEMRLATYYTREGYYNMNSALTGKMDTIAERYLREEGIGPRDFDKVKVTVEGDSIKADYEIWGDKETRTYQKGSPEYNGILQQSKNAVVQASLFHKALDKLPPAASDSLNRKINLDEEVLNQVMERYNPSGKDLPYDQMVNLSAENIVIKESRFTSTTTDAKRNNEFGDSIEFRIQAKGKDITPYSCRQDEKEVLLLPGTKLQILGIMQRRPDEEHDYPRYIVSCRQIN